MDEPAARPARPKRIYTCTPVAFSTNATFFVRDTGLIHTELKALGVESRCILALPHDPRDLPEMEQWVIRTTLNNMESAEWWREQELDGVFLYSWGAPRYTKIARAIHRAGIRLAIHLDMGHAPIYWQRHLPLHRRLHIALRELAVDFLRARHLSYADVVTTSAATYEGIRQLLPYRDARFRFCEMPNPVAPHFRPDGSTRQVRIICIGRWNDERQKRSRFLMPSIEQLTTSHTSVEVDIYGTCTQAMQAWHEQLAESVKNRIHLRGFVSSDDLPSAYNAAQIFYCPSLYEGSCVSAGEALCCGCSVVCSCARPGLNTVISYATAPGCGRIAAKDTPESMAEALLEELKSWERGERDPQAIARRWQPVFHAAPILRDIFGL